MNAAMKRSFHMALGIAILASVNQAFAQIGPSYDPVQGQVAECQMLGLEISPLECNESTMFTRLAALIIIIGIAIGITVIVVKRIRRHPIPKPSSNTVPDILPADLSRSQFMILQASHKGLDKPKQIEKYLSLDRKEIEKEMSILIVNGYLTNKGKLTSKGLEIITRM